MNFRIEFRGGSFYKTMAERNSGTCFSSFSSSQETASLIHVAARRNLLLQGGSIYSSQYENHEDEPDKIIRAATPEHRKAQDIAGAAGKYPQESQIAAADQ